MAAVMTAQTIETMAIAKRLRDLAEAGEADADDTSCQVLYGIVRDCAYEIEDRTSGLTGSESKACSKRTA